MTSQSYNTDMHSGVIICPTCGAEYGASAKFCGRDGTTLQPGATGSVDTANTKICANCRGMFPEYASFCPDDATRLQDLASYRQSEAVARPDTKPADARPANPTSAGASLVDQIVLPEQEMIGLVIADKYKVDKMLGEGGMAQVFKAIHLGIDKPVVIKVMHGGPGMQNAVKRFEMECKTTARINHPNVVSVLDNGVLDRKRPYLVMEFIKGESLRDKLTSDGKMSLSSIATIMIQVCAGLQEAHNEGIVHRDLKPENIMLSDRPDRPDWVKIVDFGIAHLKEGGMKLTATGIAVGTVDYMSPEYLSDKPIDHRADIYALGVILFELLTTQCPFQSDSAEAVMAKHLWSTPMPPSTLREELKPGNPFDLIVERSMDKEPDNRFQSCNEMKLVLQKTLMNIDDCLR